MELSSSLLKSFAAATNDTGSTTSSSGTAYGTVVVSDGKRYVLLDGATALTAVVEAADARTGDRVIVTIENHVATVTSNLSTPSSGYTASETEALVSAYYGEFQKLDAYFADITYLEAYSTMTEYLEATYADINSLTAIQATVNDLVATVVTTEYLTSNYITTTEIDATYATLDVLTSNYITAKDIEATYATLDVLTSNYITAKEIEAKYADIGLLNVSVESVGTLFANVGLLEEVNVVDGYVTGTLNGVTIYGDCIVANSIVADSLVLKGEDGLYYAINCLSDTLTSEELSDEKYQKYIDGSVIVAESITGNQIAAETITASNIASNTITADKINTIAVSAITSNIGHIYGGSITICENTYENYVTDVITWLDDDEDIYGSINISNSMYRLSKTYWSEAYTYETGVKSVRLLTGVIASKGVKYTSCIEIVNNGNYPITVSNGLGDSVTLAKKESRSVILNGTGDGETELGIYVLASWMDEDTCSCVEFDFCYYVPEIYADLGDILFLADMDSQTLIINANQLTLDKDGNATFSGDIYIDRVINKSTQYATMLPDYNSDTYFVVAPYGTAIGSSSKPVYVSSSGVVTDITSLSLSGAISTTSTLSVTGAATFSGNVTVSGTGGNVVTHTASTAIGSSSKPVYIASTGAATAISSLSLSGAISTSSTLSAGATTLSSLSVTGAATFSSNVTVSGTGGNVVTHTASTAVGGAAIPVYIASTGAATACYLYALYQNGTTTPGVVCSTATFRLTSQSGSGGLTLGNGDYKWGKIYSTSSSISTSDERVKTDIVDVNEVYENLFMKLRGVNYRYKNFTDEDNHDRIHCGLIAQEVETAMTEVGLSAMEFATLCYDDDLEEGCRPDGRTDEYGIAYSELHGLEIHMIQKNVYAIEDLKLQIAELQAQLAVLQASA